MGLYRWNSDNDFWPFSSNTLHDAVGVIMKTIKIELDHNEARIMSQIIKQQIKRCNKNPIIFEHDYEKEALVSVLNKIGGASIAALGIDFCDLNNYLGE